eukprot:gene10924-biopygen13238
MSVPAGGRGNALPGLRSFLYWNSPRRRQPGGRRDPITVFGVVGSPLCLPANGGATGPDARRVFASVEVACPSSPQFEACCTRLRMPPQGNCSSRADLSLLDKSDGIW